MMAQEEASASASRGGKLHAVVVPFPLQGHVIPAVHLALQLAARGFVVTFVNTEAVHDRTARALGVDPAGYDVFAGARASASSEMDVRYELVSDGLPVAFDRTLHADDFMSAILYALPVHVEELLCRVVATDDPAVTWLVADTFFLWPATLARKLGVAYVSLWTEPALVLNLYYHVDLLTKNGHVGSNGEQTGQPSPP
ncbi:UDP-glycosyltransferase 86A1-like [Brachypodium distachyon]|uniref:UDP-glycosyltransferase 86A1-like n=1 Tax=Brachypodium distachyon TaxID=15368 RepID=UPI000D0E0252|nr:UDP-glycosyltransferase 86A1-like [Brachypodium distachyon]|eukprot:XP_024317604.1 UDP-glycosyltransferase 86A1-like [Brachypodium distachyon]